MKTIQNVYSKYFKNIYYIKYYYFKILYLKYNVYSNILKNVIGITITKE